MIGEKNVSITHTHTPVYLDGGITSDKLNRALNIHTTPSFFFFFRAPVAFRRRGCYDGERKKIEQKIF